MEIQTAPFWRYNAFLSYSHGELSPLATQVQGVLHAIARPWYHLRAVHVFRDKSSIAPSESLWSSIVEALQESEFFLLLASPDAAVSPWVSKELEWWLVNRGTRNLILIVGAGKLSWDKEIGDFDTATSTAVPSTLRGRFSDEPLWVDVSFAASQTTAEIGRSDKRALRDRLQAELLAVAARLHHKQPDVLGGEDIRRRRTAYLLASGLAMLTLVAIGAGGIVWRESTLQAQTAQREADAQSQRAAKERIDRIVGLAHQTAAVSGVSSSAVSQLAYAAHEDHNQVNRHLQVLGYWLPYLVSAQESMQGLLHANWGDKTYVWADGNMAALEGRSKAFTVISKNLPLIYTLNSAEGKFSINDRFTGKEIHAVDISDLTVDRESMDFYELVEVKVLLLLGHKQSSSAGGADRRILLIPIETGKAEWINVDSFYQPRADKECKQVQAIATVDTPAGDESRELQIASFEVRSGLAVKSRPVKDADLQRWTTSLNPENDQETIETACARYKMALVGHELPLPSKRPERSLWRPANDTEIQNLSSQLKKMDGAITTQRELSKQERSDVLKRLRLELAALTKRSDDNLARLAESKDVVLNRDIESSYDLTSSLEAIASYVGEANKVAAIDAPDGMVIWTTNSAGAQYGEHTLCKLPSLPTASTCVVLNFHGDSGMPILDPKGRYFLNADFTYMGHRSFALADLLTMKEIDLGSYPYGTIVGADYDSTRGLLATLSASNELYVYQLQPKVDLVFHTKLEVAHNASQGDLLGEERFRCFRLYQDRVIYCNPGGGLTSIAFPGGEIQWATPRLITNDKNVTLRWREDATVGVIATENGLRLFRPDDGTVLSDWISASAVSEQKGTIQDLQILEGDAIFVKIQGRWTRRNDPFTFAQIRSALPQIDCFTGFQPGASLKRSDTLRCNAIH